MAKQYHRLRKGRDIVAVNTNHIALERLSSLDGYIGSCLVDSDSGMVLSQDGGNSQFNMEIAGASNAEVVKAKRRAAQAIGLKDEIEDILITLGKQYHLVSPMRSRPSLFVYLALDRARANLAMARFALGDAEKAMTI